jgi:hypothetical protein
MSKFTLERGSVAPAGVSIALDRQTVYRGALLVRVPNFMLEDVIDAALAKIALGTASDRDRLAWEKVKESLGL